AAAALTAGGTDSTFTNQSGVTGGSVTVSADRIDLQAGSTVTAGSGTNDVVVLQPTSLNRAVNIDNTAGDPTGELRLSTAELNTVTAGVLRVGRADDTAGLTVKSAVAAPAGWNTLSLASGGVITQTAGSTLTVTNLAVRAQAAPLAGANAVT